MNSRSVKHTPLLVTPLSISLPWITTPLSTLHLYSIIIPLLRTPLLRSSWSPRVVTRLLTLHRTILVLTLISPLIWIAVIPFPRSTPIPTISPLSLTWPWSIPPIFWLSWTCSRISPHLLPPPLIRSRIPSLSPLSPWSLWWTRFSPLLLWLLLLLSILTRLWFLHLCMRSLLLIRLSLP
jgi:hypothetical protein